MSAAVTFVITLSTLVTYLIQKGILENFGLEYLQTITFILVIAALVQMVEIIIKNLSPISSSGRLPAAHYYQLHHPGCGHIGHPERFQFGGIDCVCHLHGNRLFDGLTHFFEYPRTVGAHQSTKSHARRSHCLTHSRHFGNGLYGFLRHRSGFQINFFIIPTYISKCCKKTTCSIFL